MTQIFSLTTTDVLDIINKHDPVRLLKMGAPATEYFHEAVYISSLLDDHANDGYDNFRNVMNGYWSSQFENIWNQNCEACLENCLLEIWEKGVGVIR